MKIDYKTWVLIADGEKALFLENIGDAEYPNFQLRRLEEKENPPAREQGVAQRGRLHDGPSVHSSSVEETDWHRLEKDRFAKEMADILYRMAHGNRFEKLVVVAPPHVLGELRKDLHPEVSERIIADVPKTFTNMPIDQIEGLLAA